MKLTWMVIVLAAIIVAPLTFLVWAGKLPEGTMLAVLTTLGAWIAPSPLPRSARALPPLVIAEAPPVPEVKP